MENYVCISICVIILSVAGCLDGVYERAGIWRTDAAFAALCVFALSVFRIKPVIEFDIDASCLVLPVVFGLMAINREDRGAKTLAWLSLVSMLPIAFRAAYMLYELYITTYAFFSLRAEIICLTQFLLCAIDLAINSFRFEREKAM